jgi:EAL domain-containing protein (putative c-di-GMP-specific phosphodiesterase class I)
VTADGTVLEQLLAPGALHPVFQPIVDVSRPGALRLHALEALMRGPRGTNLEHAGVLFEYVRRRHEEARIDRACYAAVLEAAAALPGQPRVSINVHASTLVKDRGFVAFLAEGAEARGVALSRLILELLEHTPFWDVRPLLEALGEVRRLGIEVALDDVGVGQSNYRMMVECRPDYFKLDRYFMVGLGEDRYRQAVVASLASLARTLGARAVAEGVEQERDLQLVADLGVDLVQGYLLARPMPAAELRARGSLEPWAAPVPGAGP